MQSVSITISTKSDIKAKTKKIAQKQGLSVSGLINILLQQVIGSKAMMKENFEKPTPYLLKSIKTALQQKKEGKNSPRFASGKDAQKWLER